MSASYEQSEIKNVHKPKSSDMCDAIRQAVKTMESYLSDSEIKDMLACDKCTLCVGTPPTHTLTNDRPLWGPRKNIMATIVTQTADNACHIQNAFRAAGRDAVYSGQQRGL